MSNQTARENVRLKERLEKGHAIAREQADQIEAQRQRLAEAGALVTQALQQLDGCAARLAKAKRSCVIAIDDRPIIEATSLLHRVLVTLGSNAA